MGKEWTAKNNENNKIENSAPGEQPLMPCGYLFRKFASKFCEKAIEDETNCLEN